MVMSLQSADFFTALKMTKCVRNVLLQDTSALDSTSRLLTQVQRIQSLIEN